MLEEILKEYNTNNIRSIILVLTNNQEIKIETSPNIINNNLLDFIDYKNDTRYFIPEKSILYFKVS